ncbi:MAG: DUF4143 domain-containing protein [Anaerolineales bacterium]|nr:DUF4143 domain-containing protein [Anaerolineales bacterium]
MSIEVCNYLLGIKNGVDLYNHPKSSASWEGYVIEETIKAMEPDQVYFWATHSGAELDLLLIKNVQRIGVECKRVDAPRLTPSMRTALDTLELSKLLVIYPETLPYPLDPRIQVIPLSSLAENPAQLLD